MREQHTFNDLLQSVLTDDYRIVTPPPSKAGKRRKLDVLSISDLFQGPSLSPHAFRTDLTKSPQTRRGPNYPSSSISTPPLLHLLSPSLFLLLIPQPRLRFPSRSISNPTRLENLVCQSSSTARAAKRSYSLWTARELRKYSV